MSNQQDERRDYFRIDDNLRIAYEKVPREELAERIRKLEVGASNQFAIMSSLLTISKQSLGTLHRIESEEPDVANYLKALDQKIDILGRVLQAQASNLAEQPVRDVNLSASGLSFESGESIDAGEILELKLLLMPSYTGVILYAEVVGCDAVENAQDAYPFLVRVKFHYIQESDREILIQHSIHRQSQQLKKRREQRESEENN